jgi:HD-GYP domain-containing protein (c-di-GMP phosphodiesterase class II)/CheY-like chemotaxis protein
MAIVLLVDNIDQTTKLITHNLENKFSFEVVFSKDSESAIETLERKNISLIISRNKLKDDSTGKNLIDYIYDSEKETPIIILGELEAAKGTFEKLSTDFRFEELNRLIVSVLEIEKDVIDHSKLPDFVPIPLSYFYLMSFSPCNIFIRIKKRTGDQFVRRINAKEVFDKDIILSYKENNLEEFYIYKEHHDAFLDDLLAQSLNKLEVADISEGAIIEIISDSYEISRNLLDDLGFSPATVKMVKGTLQSVTKSISQNKQLGFLFKALLEEKYSYGYKHSYLISLFTFKIMPYLDWGKGDQFYSNFEKMSFVSYFHDILLQDEKHIKISSKKELYNLEATEEEKKLINEHANQISTLIQQFPKAPSDVDVILRQHHGTTNGIGFSEGNNSSISGMAILFIVLEEFVHQIFERKNIKVAFEVITDKFTQPSYRKIVKNLKESLNQNKD